MRYVLFALVFAVPGLAFAADGTKQPNILFILADDLGWGDLGCYGNPQIKTPHLDRLAKDGTLFTQFYVAGSVCSPSRCGFMTGQYPARHRVHGHFAQHKENEPRGMPDWLDPSAPILTRLLKDAGYATAHFGKWHLGNGADAPPPEAYAIDDSRTVNSNGSGFADERVEYFRARSTRLFVDETIRFIEAHQDQPFYVNLWTLVPHATLHPTDEQMEPYAKFAPGGVPYRGAAEIYYGTVTAMDAELGRLFAKLEDLGLAENTLVVFSSDNGPEDLHVRTAHHSGIGSPGPFRGRKRSLYEGGVRVPFIVRWPAQVPANRIDETSVVSAVDFLPTVCRLANVELPADYRGDGEDVSDILKGSSRARSKPLCWEWRFRIAGYPVHHSPILSVRDGDWKLLFNPDRSRVELYDVAHDFMESDNLADQHADVVDRLAKIGQNFAQSLPKGPHDPGAGQVNFAWPKTKSEAQKQKGKQ